MPKKVIEPFKNESESLQIGDLTIENRLDRLSVYGSLDITRDKEGLKAAKDLKTVIDLAVAELEKVELPDRITLEESETVENPFK